MGLGQPTNKESMRYGKTAVDNRGTSRRTELIKLIVGVNND